MSLARQKPSRRLLRPSRSTLRAYNHRHLPLDRQPHPTSRRRLSPPTQLQPAPGRARCRRLLAPVLAGRARSRCCNTPVLRSPCHRPMPLRRLLHPTQRQRNPMPRRTAQQRKPLPQRKPLSQRISPVRTPCTQLPWTSLHPRPRLNAHPPRCSRCWQDWERCSGRSAWR